MCFSDFLKLFCCSRQPNNLELNKLRNDKNLQKKILLIDDAGIDSLQFDLSEDEQHMLLYNGMVAARDYLKEILNIKDKFNFQPKRINKNSCKCLC